MIFSCDILSVNHAIWILNRVPNKVTLLTLMELLIWTNTDHKYIIHCHIWSFTIFYWIQNWKGETIYLWGIIYYYLDGLGFFWWALFLISQCTKLDYWVYISTISLFLNYLICPVCGTKEDKVVAEYFWIIIFEHNKDCYVEEKFGKNNELIYYLLTLKGVWIDKPERCYQKLKIVHHQKIIEDR